MTIRTLAFFYQDLLFLEFKKQNILDYLNWKIKDFSVESVLDVQNQDQINVYVLNNGIGWLYNDKRMVFGFYSSELVDFPFFTWILKKNGFSMILGRQFFNFSTLEKSLFLSYACPYFDGLYIQTENEFKYLKLSYYFSIVFLNSQLNEKEKELQSKVWDTNSDRKAIGIGYNEPFRFLTTHKIDFTLFEKIRFGIGEMRIAGGRIPNLADIQPITVLHNTYGEGFSNVMMQLDGEILPLPWFRIYGEFIMDDFVSSTESTNYKPTSLGWGYGYQFLYKYQNFFGSIKYENYKVYTWTYNRWEPYLKFTNKYGDNEIPIGFPNGNDIEGFLISFSLFYKDYGFKVLYENYLKGEIDLSTPYQDEKRTDSNTWEGPYGKLTRISLIKLFLIFSNIKFGIHVRNGGIDEIALLGVIKCL